MVRQVKAVFCVFAILLLLCANGTVAQAATLDTPSLKATQFFTPYDGPIPSTVLQYFKDLMPNLYPHEEYVLFRVDENTYMMVVGDLEYDGTNVMGYDWPFYYIIESPESYNGNYSFYKGDFEEFYLDVPEGSLIYGNVGEFPQLEGRGAFYETYTAILLTVICVSYVCRRIFYYRPR